MSSASGAPRRRGRLPDEARLIERFKRLAPQQAALNLAMQPFHDEGGRFDRRLWVQRFESQQPEHIRDAKAVTGLYEGLVNHLIEMLQVAARLRGLDIAKREDRPTGPALFAAVGEDGGLTDSQVTVLKRLYATRNGLQHNSPGVEAGQVYDDVELLTKTLARFVKSYVQWLGQHGVSVL